MASAQPIYTTNCRLCAKKFEGPPFDLHDNERLAKLFQAVAKHFQEAHADFISAAVIAGYATEDPALQVIAEAGRSTVHNKTRKNMAFDAQIQTKLAQAGFNEAEIMRIFPIMQDLRDCLTEQGNYRPAQTPTAPL